MAKYKLSDHGVRDTETGACIPNAIENRHWRKYLRWVEAGNIADAPDPVQAPQGPPTHSDLYDRMVRKNKVLFAILLSINDGTLAGNGQLSKTELKAVVLDNM